MTSHADHHHHGSALKTSAHATAHCLAGCVIGEAAGLAIGVTFGLGIAATIALAVILAYVAGLSLAILPVMKTRAALLQRRLSRRVARRRHLNRDHGVGYELGRLSRRGRSSEVGVRTDLLVRTFSLHPTRFSRCLASQLLASKKRAAGRSLRWLGRVLVIKRIRFLTERDA